MSRAEENKTRSKKKKKKKNKKKIWEAVMEIAGLNKQKTVARVG